MIDHPAVGEVLTSLPDTARVWVYAADRDLAPAEQERLEAILGEFCGVWRSHGRTVVSDSTVVAGRFAVIAGLIPGGDISGCGIDSSVHALDQAAAELGFSWLPSLWVHYRDESGVVHSMPRSAFSDLARSGAVGGDTRVFNLSIETLGDLRHGAFERAARDSWHAAAFGISTGE